MRRKVLRVGNASLAISLPSTWVRSHRLKPGDEIDVLERDGGVFVVGKPSSPKDEVTVDIPGPSTFARRLIYPYYVQGWNTINITYQDAAVIPLIEDATAILLGFDLVALGNRHIVLKNIAKGLEEESDAYFSRLLHTAKTMAQVILDAIVHGDPTMLEQTVALESLSNKISLFLKRSLNTQSTLTTSETTSRYAIINALEQACDGYRDLAAHLRKKKGLPKELVAPLRAMLRLHDLFLHVCTKPSTQALLALRTTTNTSKEELLQANTPGTIFLYAIVECLDNVTLETTARAS